MPRFDRTGPRGRGPGTGRGRGGCGMFAALCDTKRPPGKAFLSLATTVTGLVEKDTMNPEGITRKMLRILEDRFVAPLREPKAGEIKRVRTVNAEVLPNSEKPV
ncbi:MAG: DUF5320 family protein [Candidatus Latescibacterota bacterium]